MESAAASQPQNGFLIRRDVKAPMRDGVKLSANIFLPDTPGPHPVVLTRSPYGPSGYPTGEFYARRGYAYVAQDCRGRHDSDGEFYPFIHEANDGYDTLEWLAKQPWCNGRVGMVGPSYWGSVQLLVAPLNSPYLKCTIPSVIPGEYFNRSFWSSGAFSLALTSLWLCNEVSSRTSDLNLLPAYDLKKFFSHLPLITLDEATGRFCQFWRDYLTHSSYDDFWARINIRDKFDKMTVPTYLVGGWYDYYAGDAFKDFTGLRQASPTPAVRQARKLLMGPWSHIICIAAQLGEVDFGAHSLLKPDELYLRWFDYHLKQIPNGILNEPPVTFFTMGVNQWRHAHDWPLPNTKYTDYYFHSAGQANVGLDHGQLDTHPPAHEPTDGYMYDPANPVWTHGGNHSICWGEAYHVIQPGPFDQRQIEERPDVLVYNSAPLEKELEVTGPVLVKLFAATTAPDTDFVARLIDVYPDGRAINLTEGIIRARFREGVYQQPKLIEPGAVLEYTIELQPTSNVFLPGHRIRVDITSSCFPLWDRNPNTGHAQGMDAELRTAKQTIHHDGPHASRIILPVIPRG